MQKLGQHFLKNVATLEKIVAALALVDGDAVIEIGPGHGELTAPLLHAAKKYSHVSITCIEKDRALIPGLTALAQVEAPGRLSIIEGDALKLLPEIVSRLPQEVGHKSGYKIVGNIPYYITGKLLRTISDLDHKPARTVLLIQEEVAERICAAPPDMNRLAASVQFWADADIATLVPRKDFSPPPDVDSAVIVLDENKRFPASVKSTVGTADSVGSSIITSEHYYRAVRGIFAQPRKTLLNNLFTAAVDGVKKNEIIEQLMNAGITPESRPQDLSIEQIIALAQAPLWG